MRPAALNQTEEPFASPPLSSGLWRPASDLPVGLENCASVEYGGGLVLVGGFNRDLDLVSDAVYFFDPAAGGDPGDPEEVVGAWTDTG